MPDQAATSAAAAALPTGGRKEAFAAPLRIWPVDAGDDPSEEACISRRDHPRLSTTPRTPSTLTASPSRINSVALPVASTAAMPYFTGNYRCVREDATCVSDQCTHAREQDRPDRGPG